jgi:hypothetical protein
MQASFTHNGDEDPDKEYPQDIEHSDLQDSLLDICQASKTSMMPASNRAGSFEQCSRNLIKQWKE